MSRGYFEAISAEFQKVCGIIHPVSHEFQISQRTNPSEQVELQSQAEARREASRAIKALSEREGKKAFVIIVEDDIYKRRVVEEFLTGAASSRNVGYILSLKQDGESGIRLYKAFREQDSQEDPSKVVVILDGSLEGEGKRAEYKYGSQVARKLVDISTAHGWQVPYLVGQSIDKDMNREIEEAYPDNYVGTLKPHNLAYSLVVLDTIDSEL